MLNRMSFSDFVEEFDVEETNRIKAEFKRLKSEYFKMRKLLLIENRVSYQANTTWIMLAHPCMGSHK